MTRDSLGSDSWHMRQVRAFHFVALLIFSVSYAQAQPSRQQAAAPPAAPAQPQQTTASFADWTLRCTRPAGAAQMCEVVQIVTNQDRPIAQIAFGRVAKGQPIHLTILVPTNVTLTPAPALRTARESDAPVLELAWRRCLPAGCLAESTMTEDVMRRTRTGAEAARITFADGAGRLVSLPFSPSGLGQALDALGKEDGG